MIKRADIAAYNTDGELQLVVEVKGVRNTTPDWATFFYRNLLVHEAIPRSPYFLMVLPDVMYLWKNFERVSDPGPPDYQISTTDALTGYFSSSRLSLADISSEGLEIMVSYWLNDLLNSDLSEENAKPYQMPFIDSGLYQSIHRGSAVLSTEL